jgi:hypothetical protein
VQVSTNKRAAADKRFSLRLRPTGLACHCRVSAAAWADEGRAHAHTIDGYTGHCKVAIAAQVGCYAYFESRTKGYWYGLALHASGATVLQVARSGWEKGAPAGTCKLMKANCGS